MSTDTTPIRVAQTLGITGALFAAGLNLGFSGFVVPRILESPAPLLLKQWTRMMDAGVKTVPPLAVASGVLWFYVAWNARQASQVLGEKGASGAGGKVGRYVAAGILCAGMVPYTFLFLSSTNNKLFSMASEQAKVSGETLVKSLKGETAHQLVDRWGMLNLPRAAMLFTGGVLGLLTVME